MCDVLMLALWVWAVVLWLEGIDRGEHWRLAIAALLVALAALTKYFAVVLLPLLAVYALTRRPEHPRWSAHLLLPVAVLAAYQAWTAHLYGRGLLLEAVAYAARAAGGRDWGDQALTGLAFTGGCLALPLTLAPFLWRRVPLGLAAVVVIGAIAVAPTLVVDLAGPSRTTETAPLDLRLQFCLWSAVGIGALVLVFDDLRRSRDAVSLLLACWIVGTFVFAAFENWTVNGRSVLPMVPAVAIVLARRLEVGYWGRSAPGARMIAASLVLAGVLAFAVAWADARLADSARKASDEVRRRYSVAASPVYFQGRWGFQYYMQRWGAVPLNIKRFRGNVGDLFVTPRNNTNTVKLATESFAHVDTVEVNVLPWLTTMNPERGAGFYSDVLGPLPFTFGFVSREGYDVVRYVKPLEVQRPAR